MIEVLTVSMLLGGVIGLFWLNNAVIPAYSIACLAVGWMWWVFPVLALAVACTAQGRLRAIGILLTVLASATVCAVLFGCLGHARGHDPLEDGAMGALIGLLLGGLLITAIA